MSRAAAIKLSLHKLPIKAINWRGEEIETGNVEIRIHNYPLVTMSKEFWNQVKKDPNTYQFLINKIKGQIKEY